METKMNSNLTLGIIVLVLGFVGGYVFNSFQSTPYPMPMPTGGTHMHEAMSGMMSGLEGKKGDAFDKAFLDEMIVHHEGAIQMAEVLLTQTTRPELIELGNNIITAQTGEIEMMKQWSKEWFGR